MTTDLEDMLARLVLMQKDVTSALPGVNSVPVGFYAQEATPYWTNTIVSGLVQPDSQDLNVNIYTVKMTLVLSTVTEGWDQQAEKMIHIWTPPILLYFAQRRQLKRTSADAPLTNMYPTGAIIRSFNANYGIAQSGIGDTKFGIEFNIDVPLYQQTSQVVF